ncbi:MAG: zinc ribbon domain-containing protein [Candidatus Aenigmarchaeota archaeon]|nr:zinc ribbon domain-containing protein [Candidatus Aenigmarchaeota archaeon]
MAIIPRAIFIGSLAGLLSAVGLVYYVSKAVSPGILGSFAIAAIAVLFGIFVSLLSGTLFLLLNLKKVFADSGCVNCDGEIPGNASFCPHCGKRAVHVRKYGINMVRL